MRARLVPIAIALAVVAAVLWGFRTRPVEVDLVPVERGSMRVTVDEDGKTRVRERYVVSAPVAGRLRRTMLDAGDAVLRGKTVVAAIEPIDPAPLDARARGEAEARLRATEAAKLRAEAERARAEASLALAASDLRRVRELAEQRIVSERELEQAVERERAAAEAKRSAAFAVDVAVFEAEQARAALVHARGDGGAVFEIPSPIDGRVLRVLEESVRVVASGAPLLELGDPRELEAEIDVLSRDAVRIRPGAPVLLEQWGGSAPLAGTVRVVEPGAFTKISALGVEEQRVNVIVDLDRSAGEHETLGDGYRVEARIVVWQSDDVLEVPVGALFRRGEAWAVFVDDDGTARLREVEIGERNALEAEVRAGLAAGERVVLHPSDRVADGVAIDARG